MPDRSLPGLGRRPAAGELRSYYRSRSIRRPAAVNDPTSAKRILTTMKRALFVLLMLAVVAALTGCVQDRMYARRNASDPCDIFANSEGIYDGVGYNPYARARRARMQEEEFINPGPPTGTITYPYYTTRGPRDFLAQDLRPLGP
jgi:hypothetical protein